MTQTQLREQIAYIIQQQRAAREHPEAPGQVADRILALLPTNAIAADPLGGGDDDKSDPREHAEAVAGVRRGLESARSRPFAEFAREQKQKQGLSG